jgi:hypothetical protein
MQEVSGSIPLTSTIDRREDLEEFLAGLCVKTKSLLRKFQGFDPIV